MVTIFSNLLPPLTSLTQMVSSPSSTTVPAYAYFCAFFWTGTDSPVSDAWLTIASPAVTTPSKGITLPIWTTISSPVRIWSDGTRISCPSFINHALDTCNDMLLARSSTDFLWVHSSRISPIPRRNIVDPAVSKSPRKMDTPIAVASRTETSSFPLAIVRTPCHRYFTDLTAVITERTDTGRNILLPIRITTLLTSFSQYSFCSSRPEFFR